VNLRQKAQYQARAEIIKALAHPTRLFLVDELERGERCVCELTGLVGDDMSTVSKHLSVLKAAGLVEVEKRGLQVFYRLCCPCITRFFGCVESVLKSNARRQVALAR
jgi:ArsR family transcriptional regulator